MSDVAGEAIARPVQAASLSALGLSALEVVFGDIGTSLLYPALLHHAQGLGRTIDLSDIPYYVGQRPSSLTRITKPAAGG